MCQITPKNPWQYLYPLIPGMHQKNSLTHKGPASARLYILPSAAVVANFATTESRTRSPSVLYIVDLSRWNSSAIWSAESLNLTPAIYLQQPDRRLPAWLIFQGAYKKNFNKFNSFSTQHTTACTAQFWHPEEYRHVRDRWNIASAARMEYRDILHNVQCLSPDSILQRDIRRGVEKRTSAKSAFLP